MKKLLNLYIIIISLGFFASCKRDFVKIDGIDRSDFLSGHSVNAAAPSLNVIANGFANENETIIKIDVNDGDDDLDSDGQTITYNCFYDDIDDDVVNGDALCTSINGLNFSADTGIIDWAPTYEQSGTYEFKVTATDGTKSDNVIFSYIVNDVDAPPVLDIISNQSVNENNSIIQINAGDGGDDKDFDNDTIDYTCHYDTTVDGTVSDLREFAKFLKNSQLNYPLS